MSTPKANRQKIIDFVVICLENGEQRSTILSKVVKKWQKDKSFTRTFDRILKIANEQHKAKQDVIKKELLELDKQAAIESRKKAIMTADERKEYLTKIIQGEVEVPYTEVKWDSEEKKFKTIKFVEVASHSSRISAIAELNKMEGSYAPNQVGHTFNNPLPLTATKEEIKKIANALDNII